MTIHLNHRDSLAGELLWLVELAIALSIQRQELMVGPPPYYGLIADETLRSALESNMVSRTTMGACINSDNEEG